MKVALILCTFNRPQYLKKTLWSLERADLNRISKIIIVDDASTDPETHKLLSNFITKMGNTKSWVNERNSGIKHSLLAGFDDAFNNGFDMAINLDSDAMVRPDFVNNLLDNYFCGILTGFHCVTKNANATDRHKILYEESGLYVKQSVGGINMCINKEAYEKYVRPALLAPIGNWDNMACINAGYAYCLKESVIQHIGFDSSMGHHEQPDVADDFYYWDLPDVTLIGVDNCPERLQPAIDKCTKWIKFGDVVKLHPNINSKEQYSEYCIKELHKHINTSHMLICQHDGFVNNWMAWDDSWLKYDYIGAPWWYNDGYDVGNGGFSLRSRKLMEIVATDDYIKLTHPEDDVICRTYRPYLEKMYNIKFAPIEIAEKFSFEGYRQPNKVLKEQFGVHGPNPRTEIKKIRNEKYVVNQFQGLGDILFLVPLIRALMDEGNSVVWPIADHYFSVAKHFPDLDMRRKSEVNIPYESRIMVNTQYGKLIPYRFASELMGRDLRTCMQSKYEIYGHDWRMWRELSYKRDRDAENRLKQIVLRDLHGAKEYQLVNRYYGEAERGMTITPKLTSLLPIVEMGTIEGFTLIDWLGVIEGAKEIHTANTSIMYLLELMPNIPPTYVYKRRTWGEVNFEHTYALWGNKGFIFEQ